MSKSLPHAKQLFFLLELKLLIRVGLTTLVPLELVKNPAVSIIIAPLFPPEFLFSQINVFCLTAVKWLVNVSVSKDDVSRLPHIVQYSQAQRRYSCRCDHLHSNLFSPRTLLIQFDSATVNVFVQRSTFIFYSRVLSSACLFIVRGRGGKSAVNKKDIGAIHSRSVLMMCPVAVQFPCLVCVLDE